VRAAAAAQAIGSNNYLDFVKGYFRNAAMATVSKSALEARQMGYLRAADTIVFNGYELLYVAKQEARALAEAGYRPPLKLKAIPVAGRSGIATIGARQSICATAASSQTRLRARIENRRSDVRRASVEGERLVR
jgi:3-hydroxyacyl-CoA dehydrogenase